MRMLQGSGRGVVLLLLWLGVVTSLSANSSVRLKEIARIAGVRENLVVGYGLVVGLAGTGDSSRSKATIQSISNALMEFGVSVSPDDVSSRNVATVMITSTLQAFAEAGDVIDVNVSSMGDARSLAGGTLLMAPLKAANGQTYAIAQGQISVGGFKFDLNGNMVQKNHPTVGIIPGGATVERSLRTNLVSPDGKLYLILAQPDFTTANRVKDAVNAALGGYPAHAVHAGRIAIDVPKGDFDLVDFVTEIENLSIHPDQTAKVVINERTGTLVAGGDVRIDDVTISQGNIKIVVSTDYLVSQPTLVRGVSPNVSTAVVPDTSINVEETVAQAVTLPSGASIADLVGALREIKTSTRDVITILQSVRSAGALHAQLIIQ